MSDDKNRTRYCMKCRNIWHTLKGTGCEHHYLSFGSLKVVEQQNLSIFFKLLGYSNVIKF